jgi:hypothetical protein
MKQALLSILSTIIINFTFGEIIKVKIFYDKEWNICKESRASYVRKCNWNTDKNYFEGEFNDYLINGTKIIEGNYVNNKKNGLFIFYYESGIEWIKGEFKDNIPVGIWTWKYPNGITHFTLNFEDNNFYFINYFDENGNDISSNKINFSYSFQNDYQNQNMLINGFIINKMKEGKWFIYNNKEKVGFDQFNNDSLIKSKINKSYLNINERLINNTLFIPYSVYACDKIIIDNEVSIEDYPFLSVFMKNVWRPIESAIGILEDSLNVVPDNKPMYIDGIDGINKNISQNLILNKKYVTECKNFGWLYYEIIIDEKGNVLDQKILKSPDSIITEIALKSLKSLNTFKPAYYQGKPIKSKFSSRILFREPRVVNP